MLGLPQHRRLDDGVGSPVDDKDSLDDMSATLEMAVSGPQVGPGLYDFATEHSRRTLAVTPSVIQTGESSTSLYSGTRAIEAERLEQARLAQEEYGLSQSELVVGDERWASIGDVSAALSGISAEALMNDSEEGTPRRSGRQLMVQRHVLPGTGSSGSAGSGPLDLRPGSYAGSHSGSHLGTPVMAGVYHGELGRTPEPPPVDIPSEPPDMLKMTPSTYMRHLAGEGAAVPSVPSPTTLVFMNGRAQLVNRHIGAVRPGAHDGSPPSPSFRPSVTVSHYSPQIKPRIVQHKQQQPEQLSMQHVASGSVPHALSGSPRASGQHASRGDAPSAVWNVSAEAGVVSPHHKRFQSGDVMWSHPMYPSDQSAFATDGPGAVGSPHARQHQPQYEPHQPVTDDGPQNRFVREQTMTHGEVWSLPARDDPRQGSVGSPSGPYASPMAMPRSKSLEEQTASSVELLRQSPHSVHAASSHGGSSPSLASVGVVSTKDLVTDKSLVCGERYMDAANVLASFCGYDSIHPAFFAQPDAYRRSIYDLSITAFDLRPYLETICNATCVADDPYVRDDDEMCCILLVMVVDALIRPHAIVRVPAHATDVALGHG